MHDTPTTKFICATCGTQQAPSIAPPPSCPICVDERQYVGWDGQRWTTQAELAAAYSPRIEDDDGLLGFGMTPSFAIDQRALLLETDAGNILWESSPLVSPAAVEALEARGGVDRIMISHPHFYAAMGEWSDALGAPILLHEADRAWIQHPHPGIELWSGDSLRLSNDLTLIRAGGHFPGSTMLHWAAGPRRGGALLSGDLPQVVADRRYASFMYSYPNLIPMPPRAVRALRERLADYSFEDMFGYTWGRNIIGDARRALDASFTRYLAAVEEGDHV